jgi:hypothetical protein
MPQIQSQNPVLARDVVDNLLAALSARPAAAELVTPFVHLFTAGPNPITPTSVPGDFTEATFDGYAPVALELPLLGPINADANDRGVHNEADFVGGTVVTPGENILGYWIDDNATTPTKLYAAEQFADPVPIVNDGDYISLDVVFPGRLAFTLLS